MGCVRPRRRTVCRTGLLGLWLVFGGAGLPAQVPPAMQPPAQQPHNAIQPPELTATAIVTGTIADTDAAAVSGAQVSLQDAETNSTRTTQSDFHGVFSFSMVPEGRYTLLVHAAGFSQWKIKDVLVVHEGESVVVPEIQLGVE
jgi:hypothetical protein